MSGSAQNTTGREMLRRRPGGRLITGGRYNRMRPLGSNNNRLRFERPPIDSRSDLCVKGVCLRPHSAAKAKENIDPQSTRQTISRTTGHVNSSIDRDNVSLTTEKAILNELSQDHGAMMTILDDRLLRLRAAVTGMNSSEQHLLTYISRVANVALTNDLLPMLSERVTSAGSSHAVAILMHLSDEILELLSSKYERYALTGMEFVDVFIQAVHSEDRVTEQVSTQPRLSHLPDVQCVLRSLNDKVKVLSHMTSDAGSRAKTLLPGLAKTLLN